MTSTSAPAAADVPNHLEALGWAFSHQPTRDAYRRSTGEDASQALDRYQAWVEENIIGAGCPVDPAGSASVESSVKK